MAATRGLGRVDLPPFSPPGHQPAGVVRGRMSSEPTCSMPILASISVDIWVTFGALKNSKSGTLNELNELKNPNMKRKLIWKMTRR